MTEKEKQELVEAIVARLQPPEGLHLDPMDHYQAHQHWSECEGKLVEWNKNMEFVACLRSATAQVRTLTLKTVVTVLVGSMLGLIWMAIRGGK